MAREVLTQDKLPDEESIAAGHKRRRIQGKTRFTEAVFESCGGQSFRDGAIACPKVPGVSSDALYIPKGASDCYHLCVHCLCFRFQTVSTTPRIFEIHNISVYPCMQT